MSQKDKNHNLEKTIRKTIRQINGFKVRTGKTPTGTAPKVSVTRVWPPKKEIILQWTSDSVRLPTKDNPIIVQQLTQAQIDAIPRDRFAVAVIGPTKLTAPTFFVVPGTGEQLFLTFITHLDELKKDGNDIFALIRNHTRNGGDDIPPENEMFLPPIDDNKMSDCIMRVILHFFGNNDKAKVHGYELKLSEFCVLIHYYFLRINVLKKNGRKPFCEYLEKKVFKKKLDFTLRTFNTHANNYDIYKLADTSALFMDFRYHAPKKEQPLQKVFHEVGWNFHNSPYFAELREMKRNAEKFLI